MCQEELICVPGLLKSRRGELLRALGLLHSPEVSPPWGHRVKARFLWWLLLLLIWAP